MAQQVDVVVQIGGTSLENIKHIHVAQEMYGHHTFEIVVPFENLEDKANFFFKGAHSALVGKEATINFVPRAKNVAYDFKFFGIVTELSLNNNSELVNTYIIRGHSPTILMDDGQQRRAWVEQTLSGILGTVLGDYAGTALKYSLSPAYSAIIDYKAQYDENNWKFLSRIAFEYGEWCYYDGQQLNVGKSDTPTHEFIIDGVQHFEMSIGLKPVKYQYHHYNYQLHKEFDAPHKDAAGYGPFGDFAYGKASSVFGNSAQMLPLKDVGSGGELDTHRSTLNSMNGSDLVQFKGYGENPNLSVGTMVDVTTQKLIKPGQYKKESAGKYRITHIEHQVDEEGNYENKFVAIPGSVVYPPTNHTVENPTALPEVATVITNEDPKQLGRVKVQFHWPNRAAGKSSWVRVAFPYTGSDRGALFIPEKDDQVLLSYEADHVDFPVVVGSLYHKSPTNYWFPNNEQKIIRTKGGNKIVMKDKPGEQEFFITNANKKDTGLHINFKEDGKVTIYAKTGEIELIAKTITMLATQNITMNSECGNINAKSESGEMNLHGTQKVNVTGDEFNVKGDSSVDITAPNVDVYE
jgi:type VI secretion system secreted protein VgrG